MGIMRVENGDIFCTLDYRCPVAADQEALIAATREHLPGVEATVVEQKAPHHVPEDSELVRCLLAAYHEETGRPRRLPPAAVPMPRYSSGAWPLGGLPR